MTDPVTLVKTVIDAFLAGGPRLAEAEAQLTEMVQHEGFPRILATILCDEREPIHYRQSAGTLLKNVVVDVRWCPAPPTSPDAAPLAPTSDTDKAFVRSTLPMSLGDASSKIRTMVGLVLAEIAKHDWPDAWPDLFEKLTLCLRADDHRLVHGALRCLGVAMTCIKATTVAPVATMLMPELLRVVTAVGTYTPRLRTRAALVFRDILAHLGKLSGVEPGLVVKLLAPSLKDWLVACGQLLHPAKLTSSECGLKQAAIRILHELLADFKTLLAAALPSMVASMLEFCRWLLPFYTDLAVDGRGVVGEGDTAADDDGAGGYDSDGEMMGLESLVVQLLSLIVTICDMAPAHLEPVLEPLLHVAVGFMAITRLQVSVWVDDPNQFVADEDDESLETTARHAVQDLIGDILQSFGRKGLRAVCAALQARLEECGIHLASRHYAPISWQAEEACLLGIGAISYGLSQDEAAQARKPKGGKKAGKTKPLAINSAQLLPYLASVLQRKISDGSQVFVQGRALWCAARFVDVAPQDQIVPFLHAAVHSLQPDVAIPVRFAACRALSCLCPRLPTQVLEPVLREAIVRITQLAGASSEETLHLVLSTLSTCLKADATIAAEVEPTLTPSLIQLWMQYADNYLLGPNVSELLNTLIENPAASEGVLTRILPTMTHILQAPHEFQLGMVESVVDLLRSLLGHAPESARGPLFRLIPVILSMLGASHDAAALQSGCLCVATLIDKGADAVLAWPADDTGMTGVQQILMVTGRLLTERTLTLSAILYVGELVSTIIEKLHAGLSAGDSRTLMVATLNRLLTANLGHVTQRLLLVFARVACSNAAALMHMSAAERISLAGLTADTGLVDAHTELPGFVILVAIWSRYVLHFEGAFSRRLGFLGLLNLLRCDGATALLDTVRVALQDVKHHPNPAELHTVPLSVFVGLVLCKAVLACAEDAEVEGGFDDDDDDDDDGAMYEDGGMDDPDMWAALAEAGVPVPAGRGGASSAFAPAEDFAFLSDGFEKGGIAPFADYNAVDDDEEEEDIIGLEAHPLRDADTLASLGTGLVAIATQDHGAGPLAHIFTAAAALLGPEDNAALEQVLKGTVG